MNQPPLEINKELHDKGRTLFVPLDDYFTMEDMVKLQDILREEFTNFNGGYMFMDTSRYKMLQPAHDEYSSVTPAPSFSFITDKFLNVDKASRKYNEELGNPMPIYPRNVVKYISWIEVIITLCKQLDIPFEYHPSILDKIKEKLQP